MKATLVLRGFLIDTKKFKEVLTNLSKTDKAKA
jgi:hypothetical protein